jgi:hypothetical protein
MIRPEGTPFFILSSLFFNGRSKPLLTKNALGTSVIKQVSRFFELSFEIDLICTVFRKTNAKSLLTTNGHQMVSMPTFQPIQPKVELILIYGH